MEHDTIMVSDPDPRLHADGDDRRPSRRAMAVAAAVVAGLVVWLTIPQLVTGTFSSVGSFVRVAALVAGVVVWSRLARRFVPHRHAATVVAVVPMLVIGWVVLRPYVVVEEAEDAFPVTAADLGIDAAPTPGAAEDAPEGAATAPAADVVEAPDPNGGPGSTDPAGQRVAGEPGATDPTADPSGTAASDAATPAPEEPAAPAEPVALRSGTLQGLTGHRGSGTATIYELEDGTRFVRLEDYETGPGPDLRVYLVPGVDQRDVAPGAIDLGSLDEQRGDKNVAVPADFVDEGSWTLLIWCEAFTVEVSNATLTPPSA